MTGAIDAARAKALAHAAGEVAFLDVREHGPYGEGHPFLAVPCPFSRLEATVGALVPRAGVPVLLVDDGDGIAERAAERLAEMGYRDVSWIAGGAASWAAAGFTLFKGVNVPGKTLGECLEEAWHVPRIDASRLEAWRRQGRKVFLFDGRPASEHRKMTIPGAVSMPNGELPHRLDLAVDDPGAPVVIHCAGRTRSIVGAAGLALAGLPNPVYALENGTQGWALSGRTLAHGHIAPPLPRLDAAGRAASAERAGALMAANDIATIDIEGLRRLAADAGRTLYMLDVRSGEEFAAGSLPGAVHAPAVQLAQASDAWIGVRRARVVLADDTGLRAAITAVFLRALNYEVHVFSGVETVGTQPIERTDAPRTPGAPPVPFIEPSALAAAGATLLDLRGSLDFRAGHVDGARWTIRPHLSSLPHHSARPPVLVGPDDVVGPAAGDLARQGVRDVMRLSGGPKEWRAAGLPVVATPDSPTDAEAIDHLFFVHDRHDGNLDAARRYLGWETGLTAQLDAAERAEYRIGRNPFAAG